MIGASDHPRTEAEFSFSPDSSFRADRLVILRLVTEQVPNGIDLPGVISDVKHEVSQIASPRIHAPVSRKRVLGVPLDLSDGRLRLDMNASDFGQDIGGAKLELLRALDRV